MVSTQEFFVSSWLKWPGAEASGKTVCSSCHCLYLPLFFNVFYRKFHVCCFLNKRKEFTCLNFYDLVFWKNPLSCQEVWWLILEYIVCMSFSVHKKCFHSNRDVSFAGEGL